MRKITFILPLLAGFIITSSYADADQQKKSVDIYNQYCSVCHMAGVAGAPKAHDQAAWTARYNAAMEKVKQNDPSASKASADDLKQKTYEQLASSVINGLNAMPAGGTCPSTTCKDKSDYIGAIQFMMSEEKK